MYYSQVVKNIPVVTGFNICETGITQIKYRD